MLMIQNYFGSTRVETISYSQFKSLIKRGLVTDLAIGETVVQGNMKGGAVKEIFTPEKLKDIPQDVREGKKSYPFVAVRAEIGAGLGKFTSCLRNSRQVPIHRCLDETDGQAGDAPDLSILGSFG